MCWQPFIFIFQDWNTLIDSTEIWFDAQYKNWSLKPHTCSEPTMKILEQLYCWLWTGILETYSKTCQTSKIRNFAKIANGQKPLTIFANRSMLYVWQDSEYAFLFTYRKSLTFWVDPMESSITITRDVFHIIYRFVNFICFFACRWLKEYTVKCFLGATINFFYVTAHYTLKYKPILLFMTEVPII